MFKANRSHNHQMLRDRLRREADATQPVFSESLHERIWYAVQESPKPQAVTHGRRKAAFASRRWFLAATVSASLLAAVFVWQAAKETTTLSPAVTGNPGTEAPPLSVDAEWETDLEQIAALTEGVTKTVDTWLDTTLTEQRWAYLDQDAIVILETITNGLPFGLASIDSSEMPKGDWPSEHSMD